MFAIQNVARRAPQLSRIVLNQRRTIAAVPPREKVSVTEIALHGAALWMGCMIVPTYIGCKVLKYSAMKAD